MRKRLHSSTQITDKNITEIMFYIASLLEKYEYLRDSEILSKITAFTVTLISDLDPISLLFFLTKEETRFSEFSQIV